MRFGYGYRIMLFRFMFMFYCRKRTYLITAVLSAASQCARHHRVYRRAETGVGVNSQQASLSVYYCCAVCRGWGYGGLLCIYQLGGHCVGEEDYCNGVRFYVQFLGRYSGKISNPAETVFASVQKETCPILVIGTNLISRRTI
jgi:hypothetical protein